MKSVVKISRRRTVGARAISAATLGVGMLGFGLSSARADFNYIAVDTGSGATQTGAGGTGTDGGYWFDPANWENSTGDVTPTEPDGSATINVDANTNGVLPAEGLVYDPLNDPYNTGHVTDFDLDGQGSRFYIGSQSSVGPGATTAQPNTFTVNSGTLEVGAYALIGRDATGKLVLNGGTFSVDQYIQVGAAANDEGAQNGTITYTGGTLLAGINTAGAGSGSTSNQGLRLGNQSGNTGTLIVDNSGSSHGNAGSIQVDNFYTGTVSGAEGITDFVYDGVNNNSEYAGAAGGVVPVQSTGGNNGTGFGQISIRNNSTTYGSSILELNLDAAPLVTDGVPQNLALFTYQDGIHATSVYTAQFSAINSSNDTTYFLPEGSTFTAVYQNTTYVWDIYYDGSVGFSNSATSQIDSITQGGGTPVSAGGANSSTGTGAIVLIGVGVITQLPNGVWAASGGGSWENTPADWSNSVVPADIAVTFGNAITANSIVTLDGNQTATAVTFSNAYSYTIAQGSGGGSLDLNNGASAVPILDSLGTHTISAPVILTSNASVTVTNPGDDLIISGPISGGGGLTMLAGSGSLTLSGSNTYSGGTTVKAGALVLTDPGALPGANINVLNNAAVFVEGGTSSAPIFAGDIGGIGNLTVGSNGNAGYLKLVSSSGGIQQTSLAIGASSVAPAVTDFNDKLTTSTINSASPAAPTSTSTNYDIAASKGATSSGINNGTGDLTVALDAATTSGFVEAQALFTSTPQALTNTNDAIELNVTFKDTANLLAGGTGSSIVLGLFNSGNPQSYPESGLNNSGLNGTAGSGFATGGTSLWQGYAARFAGSGGTNEVYTRPEQNAGGTTSANQDLLFSGVGTGAFVNPAGTVLAGTQPSTLDLTPGDVYTAQMLVQLVSAGELAITNTIFNGAGTGGTPVQSAFTTSPSAAVTQSFDGLAFGFRNSGTSLDPIMDVSNVSVDFVSGTPVTEAGTVDLNGNAATIGGLTGSGTLDNVSAGGSVTVTLDGAGASTFAGMIKNTSGHVGVTLLSGTQVMAGNNTYSGPTTISGGSLVAASPGGLSPNSSIVNNSQLVIAAGTSSSPVVSGNISGSGSLIIGSAGTAAYLQLGSGTHTSSVGWSGLSIGNTSTLDIANNTLDINYANPASDPVASVVSLLTSGYGAAGNWKGTAGILSSTAGNGSLSPLLSVGYADGDNANDVSKVAGLTSNEVLIRYTLAGDANLDGQVNFNDLLIVAQDFNKTGEDWVGGNFIYSPTGLVNFNDLLIVAQNFNKILSPAGSSDVSVGGSIVSVPLGTDNQLPEPTAFSLVAIGAGGMLKRRRKSRPA
jgi:fibronectin-binding autotransporter adhesin